MSMGVDLTWAGGEHRFELDIARLRALQNACDAGPAWVLARLGSKQWMVDDVIQPIRLGLEGGGMDKEAARKLVDLHVEGRPLSLSIMTAQAILLATLYGGAEEDADDEGEPNRAAA